MSVGDRRRSRLPFTRGGIVLIRRTEFVSMPLASHGGVRDRILLLREGVVLIEASPTSLSDDCGVVVYCRCLKQCLSDISPRVYGKETPSFYIMSQDFDQ